MTTAWRDSKTAVDSDDVVNKSGVAGASVTEALDALSGAVGGSTDDITNASGVSGTTASDALDTLASNLVAEASTRAAADLLLAPLASPVLTGNPRGPTPTLGDNDTSLATTAFVAAALAAAPAAAWGGITGTLSNQSDLVAALAAKAALASPTFTGTPAAPTATPGTSTTQLATTAFVTTADNLKAPLASPTFTGTPAAPTAAPLTGGTQLATAGYADAATAAEAAARIAADALKAPLASPALTGVPTAPTAAPSTNTTQLATTAFVTAASKIVYFTVTFDGTTVSNNNGYIVVPAPGAGTILSYSIAFYSQTSSDLTIYASQSGISYFPGATITSANNPGETVSASPVGAVYAAGAGIEFEIATTNLAPGVCTAMVKYQLD